MFLYLWTGVSLNILFKYYSLAIEGREGAFPLWHGLVRVCLIRQKFSCYPWFYQSNSVTFARHSGIVNHPRIERCCYSMESAEGLETLINYSPFWSLKRPPKSYESKRNSCVLAFCVFDRPWEDSESWNFFFCDSLGNDCSLSIDVDRSEWFSNLRKDSESRNSYTVLNSHSVSRYCKLWKNFKS